MNRAEQVRATIDHCLYKDGEILDKATPPEGAVKAQGIRSTFYFHPGRLEAKRQDVAKLLTGFDDNFYEGKGGGWSFLNLCMTKDGDHWAEHPTMESLVVLGIGLGLAAWLAPRNMWPIFPGGMPYVVIKKEAAANG